MQGLDCIAEIAMRLTLSVYFKDDVVFYQGDLAREVFFIRKGSVNVLVEVHEGENHTTGRDGEPCTIFNVASLGVGQSFGEIGVGRTALRTATVEASAITECLILSQRDYQEVIAEYPELHEALEKHAAAKAGTNQKPLCPCAKCNAGRALAVRNRVPGASSFI